MIVAIAGEGEDLDVGDFNGREIHDHRWDGIGTIDGMSGINLDVAVGLLFIDSSSLANESTNADTNNGPDKVYVVGNGGADCSFRGRRTAYTMARAETTLVIMINVEGK